jgi:CRISPR-associated protein Cmr2
LNHLLAIAVGPVQEFIAAARRTRDLWFGSYLLSEISRAVAESVDSQGGGLIFPASLDVENVANVIVANIDSDNPRSVALKAKQAAQARWLKFVDDAWERANEAIRQEIWDDQKNDVIEFYAAWVERTDSYSNDRAKVMRLLTGRKNCRDFEPARGRARVLKSSLDGQRESVLKDPERERRSAALRIRTGEQLDVVGLVKRVAEGHRPYLSVSSIAAEPWLRGYGAKLDDVRNECAALGPRVVRKIKLDQGRPPCGYNAFPYEGTVLYVPRHDELVDETGIERERLRGLQQALAKLLSIEKLPEPSPYLAVLVADGDTMGSAISNLKDEKTNRCFSHQLAQFGREAKTIVNNHFGELVYAGGDDVLAFLPVDQCLPCARQLRDTFVELLKEFPNKQGKTPTLSVGIAIGHFMDSLEDLLQYGRAAEKAAKAVEGKDALAVHLHKRGGAPILVRGPWSQGLDRSLTNYADLLRSDAIPGKLPYDLRKLADIYANWPPGENLSEAIRRDVVRVIRDKQPPAGKRYMKHVEQLAKSQFTDAESLKRFAEALLVAKQVADAKQQANEQLPKQYAEEQST